MGGATGFGFAVVFVATVEETRAGEGAGLGGAIVSLPEGMTVVEIEVRQTGEPLLAESMVIKIGRPL